MMNRALLAAAAIATLTGAAGMISSGAPEKAEAAVAAPGQAASVTSEMQFPTDGQWMHSFDAYESESGKPNGAFRRALGFLDAMAEQGVDPDRVKVAIVVHGPAVFDVVKDARYGAKYPGKDGGEPQRNPAYNDIAELVSRGAEIWVCGVAASHHGVNNDDLLDGVKMAPSGTIAHAELQRRGYTINPY